MPTLAGLRSGCRPGPVSTTVGIVGAATLPGLSEKVGLRKPFLVAAAAIALPTISIIGFVPSRALGVMAAAVLGFFLLPALPISFTIVGEMKEIGPRLAATAVGSIGSVGIPLLMEVFARTKPGDIIDYRTSMLMLVALILVALVVVVISVRESGPRRREFAEKA